MNSVRMKIVCFVQIYRARLDKDAKPGALVSQLNVERADKHGKNLHYHISIVSGNDVEYFSVNRFVSILSIP
jgi:hypothetical protein